MSQSSLSASVSSAAVSQPPAAGSHRFRRVIGCLGPAEAGPLLVCFGGLHGNEPSGVLALERVTGELKRLSHRLRGQFWAVAGNLNALTKGIRFDIEDLNRVWTDETVSLLRASPDSTWLRGESREQFELLGLLDHLFDSARRSHREAYCLDLHTTSSESGPFAIIGDTLRNRDFVRHFPIPIILGLEEQIDGALLEYANNRGAVTAGFEAGQHGSPHSPDRHEAVVWIGLVSAGLLAVEDCPRYDEVRRLLEHASLGLPRVMEVRYRHAITPQDGYATMEGFVNFQGVRKAQVIGRDRRGVVTCPEEGRLLMPLYQKQGTDGFFVVRPFPAFWLAVSRALRRLRLHRLLPLLPGIRKHPRREGALIVNTRVARWRAVEIFHLLGYRKRRVEGDQVVFSRRNHDLRSPFDRGTCSNPLTG